MHVAHPAASAGVCHRVADACHASCAHPAWHPDGAVKLSDFGLGALPNPGGQADLLRTTCGTPNYVAPEASRVVNPLVLLSSLAPGPPSRLDAQACR